jgi:hypothetical protein
VTATVIGLMPIAVAIGGGVWFQSWAQRGARQQGGHAVSMTIDRPRPAATEGRRPADLAERVEVHDLMRAVLGEPERMANPHARAVYLLDATLIRRARTA